MKSTRIKVSMSQDGSLSKEAVNTGDFQFPIIPKKLLRSMGFEKVDDTTYVGIMSVFLNLEEKDQEIEIELGVEASDTRKKVLDFFKRGFRGSDMANVPEGGKKNEPAKKAAKHSSAKTSKSAAVKKTSKPATKTKPAAKAKPATKKTAKSAASKATKPSARKKAG